MRRFAQIVDGLVTNVVIADQDWIDMQGGEWIECLEQTIVDIGWEAINGVIINPYEITE